MKIIVTADGSHTIYVPGLDEQYHSVNGAITESEHVYLRNGYLFHPAENPVVFEVGFGTGLNCLLTALQAEKNKRPTSYIAVEKFPMGKDLYQQLNYGSQISNEAELLYNKINSCNWDSEIELSQYFRLTKLYADLLHFNHSDIPKADVVYFDAFAPDKQPEMWTRDVFSIIAGITKTNGILVTYSAKGQVRRDLESYGFKMERLLGPPGKNEMLRGIKLKATI